MLDLEEMVAAINADLANVTKARVVAYDEIHIYLFENGIEELSRSGRLSVRQLSYLEIKAFYDFYGKNRPVREYR